MCICVHLLCVLCTSCALCALYTLFVLWAQKVTNNILKKNKLHKSVQKCTGALFALFALYALCVLFQKKVCTSEVRTKSAVHFSTFTVVKREDRRISWFHLYRHTSGRAIKKQVPTICKLVPGTVGGLPEKVHHKCKKCKKWNPQFADVIDDPFSVLEHAGWPIWSNHRDRGP
jgi:hypothetical protein